ncbi:hypothetical protein [Aquisalinus flavus]|uniref:Uncharacterized protein n=1 Tax=Aquisalinus flavus TaxID=1526572 RepID=A0A8J2Y6B1_9PROT|nr:hypothetical protein [Aquisalinus flavus]MBD0426458.1 hypothetical protein [Aquisalinus flavus]UNE47988.1 hypothetical protein FF099_07970 [Aquisalinus flavus]GGD07747.1 hypothetical protein GCM10011342_15780 [Aquisalinus flavus]
MKTCLISVVAVSLAATAACEATVSQSNSATPEEYADNEQFLPEIVRDGETYAFRDWYGEPAPSAFVPCADETRWRLPISGRCVGVVDYDALPSKVAAVDYPGCTWVNTEADFGVDALLFRALGCSDQTTELDYGGGAHAAELTYAVSPAYGDIHLGHVAVRIATYWGDDEFRLRETIPEETMDACEIRPAGEGYPGGAMVIAPRADAPSADCGLYAQGTDYDTFWMVSPDKDYVYAVSLPAEGWDIDPFSFEVVTPE